MAENCTGTLHNLYTLRGAQVRDGTARAKYITEAITLYADEADVVFQSHNWPHWGRENLTEYLENTAAIYKFINDQTLEYINCGYTSDEISNMISLPEALEKVWYTRQYYGTLSHNAKAVYQKYMGWYDANPVNLNPLTPTESAKKWVEYLGDTDKVLAMAKADFDKGEYRWVAEITNTLVFADPENEAARLLCADALEQLGYQAESGPWRNAYLTAALERRYGNQALNSSQTTAQGILMELTPGMIFDYMAILMDKEAMANEDFMINVTITDLNQQHMLHVKNGVLLVYENAHREDTDVSVTCPKNALLYILAGNVKALDGVPMKGNTELIAMLSRSMNRFPVQGIIPFNIVEP